MNIIDIAIVLLILMFGIIGAKRGILKQLVMTLGTLLIFFLSFRLREPLASFFCNVLPFFQFGGSIEGVEVLNILLYQLLAFLLVFGILSFLLGILIHVTGIIEKVLKFTIILGIPSKILGFIVGLIEGYIVLFIALFFLRQPSFMTDLFVDSRLSDRILNSTPVLSTTVGNINDTVNDVYDLIKTFDDENDKTTLNQEVLDTMLKYKITSKEQVEKLIEKGKLKQKEGLSVILDRY